VDQVAAAGPSPADTYILAGLGVALLVSIAAGTTRGLYRGPVRALATLIALVAAVLVAWLFGSMAGHALLTGTKVPWLLRGALGVLILGSVVWLVVFGYLWWRGRTKNPAGDPESPVSGAIVGCWVGILWFSVGLTGLLALAGIGESWTLAGGRSRAPAPLRWPMRVKSALASWPGTEPISRFNPVPEAPRRVLRKVILVLHDPKAFRRLQNDESVRAIAAHPSFYPLMQNPEIKDLARRQDARGLLSHPLVIDLLADEEFQRRLGDADIEPMLDRALSSAMH
jgi:hypothetical protein